MAAYMSTNTQPEPAEASNTTATHEETCTQENGGLTFVTAGRFFISGVDF